MLVVSKNGTDTIHALSAGGITYASDGVMISIHEILKSFWIFRTSYSFLKAAREIFSSEIVSKLQRNGAMSLHFKISTTKFINVPNENKPTSNPAYPGKVMQDWSITIDIVKNSKPPAVIGPWEEKF